MDNPSTSAKLGIQDARRKQTNKQKPQRRTVKR